MQGSNINKNVYYDVCMSVLFMCVCMRKDVFVCVRMCVCVCVCLSIMYFVEALGNGRWVNRF